MDKYHKIHTLFERDPNNKFKTVLLGEYALEGFEYLKDNIWTFTEKVDGTNVRIQYSNGKVAIKGKTDKAQLYDGLAQSIDQLIEVEKLEEYFNFKDVCLYGEGPGEKIQSGGKYRKGQSFVLFDINVDGMWLERGAVTNIAKILGLDIVPIIGYGKLFDMVKMCQDGFKSRWGDFVAEGIVARTGQELFDKNGNRMITKLKYKDFAR